EAERDRRAANLEGIGADHGAAQVVTDVGVHPLDDGDDRHQEPDRHDDAEEGEEGAQLAPADRGEGEEYRFAERHRGKKGGKTERWKGDGMTERRKVVR